MCDIYAPSIQSVVFAQSDQGLHCLQTESMASTECMNGEQRPGRFFVHAQDDLNPSIAEHDMRCLSKQCRSRSVGF